VLSKLFVLMLSETTLFFDVDYSLPACVIQETTVSDVDYSLPA
jgi:hypothetical protein